MKLETPEIRGVISEIFNKILSSNFDTQFSIELKRFVKFLYNKSFSYFIGDKVFTSELIEPSYQYDDTGKYDVTLIAMDTISRCRTSVTKKVEVVPNMNCGLKFPNAFTPELIKDRIFLPGYIEGIQDKGYDLKIYNRWGQLLFETEYRNIGWDGIYKGDMCKQDVYVYQCKALCENGNSHRPAP